MVKIDWWTKSVIIALASGGFTLFAGHQTLYLGVGWWAMAGLLSVTVFFVAMTFVMSRWGDDAGFSGGK